MGEGRGGGEAHGHLAAPGVVDPLRGAGEGEEEAHGLLDQGGVAPLGHEEEDAPGPHHGVHLPAEAEEVAFGPGLHLEEPGPGEVQLDAHLGLVGEAEGVR